MKYLYIIFVIALFSFSSIEGAKKGNHLFILSGQSNMARLDAKQSFIPAVKEEFGKDNIIVIKNARGGQPIRRWYKRWESVEGEQPKTTGDLYNRLMKKVGRAIQDKKIKSVTFIWMQGERDARKSHGEVYASSLRGLIDQLRNDLNRKDINIVIGRLSDFDMANKKYPHWTIVRKAQMKVAEAYPHGVWVNTDDLNDKTNSKGKKVKNRLHYTAEGYKTLGKRFAEKAIELIKNKSKNM